MSFVCCNEEEQVEGRYHTQHWSLSYVLSPQGSLPLSHCPGGPASTRTHMICRPVAWTGGPGKTKTILILQAGREPCGVPQPPSQPPPPRYWLGQLGQQGRRGRITHGVTVTLCRAPAALQHTTPRHPKSPVAPEYNTMLL